MAPTLHQFEVTLQSDSGSRLDQFAARALVASGLAVSRAAVLRLIAQGHVQIDGRAGKAAARLRHGQRVRVCVPPVVPASLSPVPMPLSILFEDDDLLVLDKAPHLPVHPGAGSRRATLVEGLLAHGPCWSGIGGVSRPGIVHRLDADTTGVMVVAKHDAAHRHLAQQFADRRVRKHYLALASAVLAADAPRHGTIDTFFGRHPVHRQRFTGRLRSGARRARSKFRVLAEYAGVSLVEVLLLTGRTHQARVHLAELGLPLLGDRVYGSSAGLRRAAQSGLTHQALHAFKLSFCHPRSLQPLTFVAPPPASWMTLAPPSRVLPKSLSGLYE